MIRKKFLVISVLIGALLALGGLWMLNEFGKQEKNSPLALSVYFNNEFKNPNAADCSLVFPVDRKVTVSGSPEEAALVELLKGPTDEEKKLGYNTAINSGVKINSLMVKDGIARVDFDKKMNEALGGSCRVGFIRAQIETTLKQFKGVNQVAISVQGSTEDAIQP